ncbi:MAG: hypothetical protein JWN15_3644, partial [Firmicutes bacterium]|nr:hypothetical protein [Bacillota bacterium]
MAKLIFAAAVLLLLAVLGRPGPVLGDRRADGARAPAGLSMQEHRIATQQTIGSELLELGRQMPLGALGSAGQASVASRLASANAQLKPFGYRIGQAHGFDIYHGDELVLMGISFFSPVTVSARQDDFLFMAGMAGERYWLIRADGAHDWGPVELARHRFQPPVYAGDALVAVRWDDSHGYAVWADEQRIFTVPMAKAADGSGVKRLTAWDGHWVLEVTGDVYIDGKSLSQQQGYSEVFDWQLVDGRPLYFFRRGSQTGLAYAGQVLPYRYEQVPHHLCCEPASLNPQGDESG